MVLMSLRITNPLYMSNFIFKLSSIGKQFYKAVDIAHNTTRKVILISKSVNGGYTTINRSPIDRKKKLKSPIDGKIFKIPIDCSRVLGVRIPAVVFRTKAGQGLSVVLF